MSTDPGGHAQDRRLVVGIVVVLLVVAVVAAVLLLRGGDEADGTIDGSTVEATIDRGGPDRGFEGMTASCPDRMTPRNGAEATCTFVEGSGLSGTIAVVWEGDEGDFTWLVQVGTG